MTKTYARRTLTGLGLILAVAAAVWTMVCMSPAHEGMDWTSAPATVYFVLSLLCLAKARSLR